MWWGPRVRTLDGGTSPDSRNTGGSQQQPCTRVPREQWRVQAVQDCLRDEAPNWLGQDGYATFWSLSVP
jgi:hypothetical protein